MQIRIRRLVLFIVLILGSTALSAQYISRSEPVPYSCPSICQGGTLLLKVPQIQNLPTGSTVQAWLSNATGSFASGTQILEASEFSTNQGASWSAGPYVFTSNINDLYLRVVVPITTPVGNGYTILMRSSSGYVATDLYQCGGTNSITVTAYVPPLPVVASTTYGTGQWFGHVFTWTPTTNATLNTPALVNAQSFFNAANYQGHVIYNPLSLDVNFTTTGGVPGTVNNGTSIDCGNSYAQNFSMRLLRTENFAPGFYQFSIQGDDGIRFSYDGGVTWILSSWLEQTYASSLRSTNAAFPNGICLSGPTDLVIEYFQRPADARLTFTVTPLGSLNFTDPTDVTVCAGDNTSFTVGALSGVNCQWFMSTDNGTSYQQVSNGAVFSGATSPTLVLTNVTSVYDDALFYCEISGSCGNPVQSETALLQVSDLPAITVQPLDEALCAGQTISFSAQASGNGLNYQWQVSTNGGVTFNNVPNAAPYSGVTSQTLTLTGADNSFLGYQYQLVVSGCGGEVVSNPAELIVGANLSITQQPVDETICPDELVSFTVNAVNATGYQWQIFDGNGWVNLPEDLNLGFSNTQTNQLNLSGVAVASGTITIRCLISGGCSGDIPSDEAVLQVLPNVLIVNETVDQTVCEGNSAGFSINVSGSNTVLQWQISTDGGASFTNLTETPPYAQVNSDFLVISTVSASLDGALFRCVVNGDCGGPINTTPAILNVETVPSITVQPADDNACGGETVVFSTGTAGSGTWQWEVSTDGGLTFSNVSEASPYSGSATPTLSVNGVSGTMDGWVFRAILSACGTSITSNSATLTVLPTPEIVSFASPPPVCAGESTSLLVTANNATAYQWEINTGSGFTSIVNGGVFSGSNSAELELNNITNDLHTAQIRCVVSGVCQPDVVSEAALLFVNGIPELISTPTSTPTCSGNAIVLPVVAGGEGLDYQWEILTENGDFEILSDDGFYSGSSTSTLQILSSSELDSTVVRCVISGCGTTIETDSILISILQNDPVYIPSAFTPDEDQINREFKIYTVGNPELDAAIFNRWGELLFEWDQVEMGWDGRYMNTDVPDGVYVYRVKVKTACEDRTYMGTVSLFR